MWRRVRVWLPCSSEGDAVSLWHRHPGVRTGDDLTIGERAADRMRDSFGSWTFIGATMLFIAA